MAIELGGNIILDNFDLDGSEMSVVKKMIGKYAEKIRHFTKYQELKVEMKSHSKGKNKHFEIKAHLTWGGERASAEAQGTNPFVLIDEVGEKIIQEVEHKIKKENKEK